MGATDELHNLVECKLFTWQASQLASTEDVDRILTELTWAIAYMPDAFPLVRGSDEIRQGVKGPVPRNDGSVADLVILFWIVNPATVEMLSIEARAY